MTAKTWPFLLLLLILPGFCISDENPVNVKDKKESIVEQIKSTEEELRELTESLADSNSQFNGKIVQLLEGQLKEKSEAANVGGDKQQAVSLQGEIENLDGLQKSIREQKLAFLEQSNKLDHLRIQSLIEIIQKQLVLNRNLSTKRAAELKESQSFMEKALVLADQEYDLSKKILDAQEKNDQRVIKETRDKMNGLKRQTNELISTTQENLSGIQSSSEPFLNKL